jgi:hypothetical protein
MLIQEKKLAKNSFFSNKFLTFAVGEPGNVCGPHPLAWAQKKMATHHEPPLSY